MKIMYTRPEDNGLSIVIGAIKSDIERSIGHNLTDEEYKNLVIDTVPKNAVKPTIIEDSGIPTSREYRDAWENVTSEPVVSINLPKSKDIQLTRLREKRDALLVKYDGKMSFAVETDNKDQVSLLKVKKQELRDSTNNLKNLTPKSIDDIKSATPSLDDY
jgi:hypothetical protein